MISSLLQPTLALDGKKYKVVHQIAEGGFGFVYQVRSVNKEDKNTIYALKKMICQSPEQISEANKEIRVLSSIKHPNVISLLASSSVLNKKAQEEYMLLFPLYSGSVQTIIDKGRGYPTCSFADGVEVVHIIRQAIEGLCAVHNAGYRHADFKPANILISADRQQVVLTDFGSATQLSRTISDRHEALAAQDEAAVSTTASFRSPELFNTPSSCTLDGKCDVWSFGCLIYSMFFSRTPFETAVEGLSVLSVMSAQYTVPVPHTPSSAPASASPPSISHNGHAGPPSPASSSSQIDVVLWPQDYIDTMRACLDVDLTKRIDVEQLKLRIQCWTLPPLDFAIAIAVEDDNARTFIPKDVVEVKEKKEKEEGEVACSARKGSDSNVQAKPTIVTSASFAAAPSDGSSLSKSESDGGFVLTSPAAKDQSRNKEKEGECDDDDGTSSWAEFSSTGLVTPGGGRPAAAATADDGADNENQNTKNKSKSKTKSIVLHRGGGEGSFMHVDEESLADGSSNSSSCNGGVAGKDGGANDSSVFGDGSAFDGSNNCINTDMETFNPFGAIGGDGSNNSNNNNNTSFVGVGGDTPFEPFSAPALRARSPFTDSTGRNSDDESEPRTVGHNSKSISPVSSRYTAVSAAGGGLSAGAAAAAAAGGGGLLPAATAVTLLPPPPPGAHISRDDTIVTGSANKPPLDGSRHQQDDEEEEEEDEEEEYDNWVQSAGNEQEDDEDEDEDFGDFTSASPIEASTTMAVAREAGAGVESTAAADANFVMVKRNSSGRRSLGGSGKKKVVPRPSIMAVNAAISAAAQADGATLWSMLLRPTAHDIPVIRASGVYVMRLGGFPKKMRRKRVWLVLTAVGLLLRKEPMDTQSTTEEATTAVAGEKSTVHSAVALCRPLSVNPSDTLSVGLNGMQVIGSAPRPTASAVGGYEDVCFEVAFENKDEMNEWIDAVLLQRERLLDAA